MKKKICVQTPVVGGYIFSSLFLFCSFCVNACLCMPYLPSACFSVPLLTAWHFFYFRSSVITGRINTCNWQPVSPLAFLFQVLCTCPSSCCLSLAINADTFPSFIILSKHSLLFQSFSSVYLPLDHPFIDLTHSLILFLHLCFISFTFTWKPGLGSGVSATHGPTHLLIQLIKKGHYNK